MKKPLPISQRIKGKLAFMNYMSYFWANLEIPSNKLQVKVKQIEANPGLDDNYAIIYDPNFSYLHSTYGLIVKEFAKHKITVTFMALIYIANIAKGGTELVKICCALSYVFKAHYPVNDEWKEHNVSYWWIQNVLERKVLSYQGFIHLWRVSKEAFPRQDNPLWLEDEPRFFEPLTAEESQYQHHQLGLVSPHGSITPEQYQSFPSLKGTPP
ncbi:MAG TPA: hypothetical protein VN843_11560 [Anaerolineales bacterium]|nr:hypothetical protein [Anaerolineales bacterium]